MTNVHLSIVIISSLLCWQNVFANNDDHGAHNQHNKHREEQNHSDHEAHEGHDHHEHEMRGPHGGRLLREDDIQVELLIAENGQPPRFRAWITQDGSQVKSADLRVTLSRLGGQQNVFHFQAKEDHWWSPEIVTEPHSFDVTATLILDDVQHIWHWQSYEGRVEISPDLAKQSGINTAVVGQGTIKIKMPVYGRLTVPPDQIIHVQGRFPGIVKEVRVAVGDQVKRGDTLAVIESNESLNTYPVKAEMSGIIQHRLINVGELTDEGELFTLVDMTSLWAELHVFPAQRYAIQTGQTVLVNTVYGTVQSVINNITPTLNGQPYVVARVVLDNDDNRLAPGDMVKAEVITKTVSADKVVEKRALQKFRNWQVVFIRVGNQYEIRPVEVGKSDHHHVEILSGLTTGDEYVTENSYLIKADIEKSGAAHHH